MVNILEVEFWRCEQHRSLHFNASEQVWEDLKRALTKIGLQVRERELKPAIWQPVNDFGIHKAEEVIRALFEIQGLSYGEGADLVSAIESLIAKYAALR